MRAGEALDAAPRVYLLDVEGTTSPVSLVSQQLFPYARKHLANYLGTHWNDPATQSDMALLAEENLVETAEHPAFRHDGTPDQALAYLLWLMDQDRKSTALKSLQGRIWKSGYESGELIGTVFADVAEALARWSKTARVAIYSSGSVEAQQLIFRHSSAGDLTQFISANFDTRTGAKTSAESYRAIAAALKVEPAQILFLSDQVRELDPAREAGCQTRLAIRSGNAPIDDANGHAPIHSFAELA